MGKGSPKHKLSETSDCLSVKPPITKTVKAGLNVPSSYDKKRKDKVLKQFISDILTSLKKEMLRQKKIVFSWDDYTSYFTPDSPYLQTYLLPLFRFLNKTSIICSRYGCFDGKHRVKTSEGAEKLEVLFKANASIPATSTDYISPEVAYYM